MPDELFKATLVSAFREAIRDALTAEERKQLVKDAMKEWADEHFARLGRWSLGGILAAAVAALGYWTFHAK